MTHIKYFFIFLVCNFIDCNLYYFLCNVIEFRKTACCYRLADIKYIYCSYDKY